MIIYKNGLYKTRLHNTWQNMKQRCYNVNNKRFKNYGGRGIGMCAEWLNDFKTFYDWSMANGYKEGLSIERINVNGNYEPSNCTWIPKNEQPQNCRSNVILYFKGQKMYRTQLARKYNINCSTLRSRLKRGLNIEDALNIQSKGVKND